MLNICSYFSRAGPFLKLTPFEASTMFAYGTGLSMPYVLMRSFQQIILLLKAGPPFQPASWRCDESFPAAESRSLPPSLTPRQIEHNMYGRWAWVWREGGRGKPPLRSASGRGLTGSRQSA